MWKNKEHLQSTRESLGHFKHIYLCVCDIYKCFYSARQTYNIE